ncbi:pyruvate/2-oxoglutarate dehydrogenase complex, dihydrolipoamide acyltransferase (E2) component [Thioclava sp. SK-1]|uniref:DUF3035 domain-containing protein n=1 Tax=Thioclava sp. SK-1 TaxID=1889770 RepID=UPI0008260378|nr:DUF3035 domain-containing protein [Thioclava sp. SK-1]OCX65801.1 pyruvate/2-oxoglutarate dehydrogenase complex, dihydrolipoamide acyltransferase (E2) component [Thioclava sp. SK-1]
MQTGRMLGIAVAAVLSLSACGSDRAPKLMFLKTATGPDEFAILPTKPLEMPTDLASLPAPTPGGGNITDPTPERDAVAALGGNPNTFNVTGNVPDNGIVAYASRNGTDPGIRQTLAAEDLAYRKANDGRLLQRLFQNTIYYRAYAPMALDQEAELEFWRKAGAKTPSAPPSAAAQQSVQ